MHTYRAMIQLEQHVHRNLGDVRLGDS